MSLGLKATLFFLRSIFSPVLALWLKIYNHRIDKRNPLPPVTNPILLLPAHQLAAKIRRKELTSTQVVKSYIERIEQVQPLINCVVQTCFKEALEQASHVDEILVSGNLPDEYSEVNAPLLGVPFSCKESIWVKGMSNSTGLVRRKDFRAPDDADVVKNMRRAGAILLCTTNTPELCMWIESRNHLTGISRNPYNLSRIVGGSSGGEAGLLSSAGSVIGIGSDIGGSIRIPSFFNGTYGHKSSFGLISNKMQHPNIEGIREKMLSTGPMCRYASDLRLLFKVQAGELYSEVANQFESDVDLTKITYYVIEEFEECVHATPPSVQCRAALRKAVDFIESSFNTEVKKIDSKMLKDAFMMWSALSKNGQSMSNNYLKALMDGGDPEEYRPYREFAKCMLRRSDNTFHAILYAIVTTKPFPEPEKYIQMGDELRKYFNTLLGRNSVIIAPSFPTVAPYHTQPVFVNTYDFIYFGLFNLLQLPSTQCPMGLCPESGLPLGIQIVSNDKCDHLTISLAEYFENNLTGWVPGFALNVE